MTNLKKKLTTAAILVAAGCAATALVVACSSDDGGGSSSGTVDGGGDTGNGDTGTTDSGGNDAGPDRVNVEAGTLADFLKLNPEATCERYKECCNGATFNTAKCLDDFKGAGWVQTLADLSVPGASTSANITYDPAAGSECLTTIRNMTCKNTTAAEYKNSLIKCFGATTGKATIGTSCVSSAECVGTAYCDTTNDAGAKCTALKTTGQDCDYRIDECSYRGAGTSQCLDDGTGTTKCAGQLDDGKDCNQDFECKTYACHPVDLPDGGFKATCDTTTDFLQGICEIYATPKDAGDGG